MSPLFSKEKDDAQDNGREWLLPEDARKQVEKIFANLPTPVTLSVFTGEKGNEVYNDYMARFADDVGEICPNIEVEFFGIDGEEALTYGVEHSPTMLVSKDDFGIRFVGAPLGEEGRAFVESVLRVSSRESGLSPTSAQILEELGDKRHVRVFTSPG
ncbi:MAG: hypothetical protein D6E12_09535 [Desulfovibrio sp.]|nr:MAG: hypothetical protein D6E12_09535 [Desulfovibrio sp.]